MAIFLIDTWVPIRGKEKENEEVIKKILQYGAGHPEVFKYVRSLQCFKQSIGGKPPGRCVLITEFNSLSEMETFFKEISTEPEWQRISTEWRNIMEQTTIESMIWRDLKRELWTKK